MQECHLQIFYIHLKLIMDFGNSLELGCRKNFFKLNGSIKVVVRWKCSYVATYPPPTAPKPALSSHVNVLSSGWPNQSIFFKAKIANIKSKQ